MTTTQLPQAPRHRFVKHWRPFYLAWVAALLAFAGMLSILYPYVASWLSQYNQSQVVAAYAEQEEYPASEEDLAELSLAHEYNNALESGALYNADTNLPAGTGESSENSLDYNTLLDAGLGLMGRLQIPAINLDLPIYHGTSDATLLAGLGHLEGTSLPVGGEGTRSVITGHRGLANATMFTYLNEVEVGDTFTISVFGEILTYQVVETKVIEPSQTEELYAEPGRDLVTLVTCTPLGINSHRILVTGERITPTPEADVAAALAVPDIPGFPWWAVFLAAGTAVIALFVWRSGYFGQRRPQMAGAANLTSRGRD